VDVRQKLFQILGELVLVEKFLMAVVGFDEKIDFRLVLLKKVDDFLALSHRLQVHASEHHDLARIEAEELTRWIVSRIFFAVWNTLAASPTVPATMPNVSAAISSEMMKLQSVYKGSRLAGVQNRSKMLRQNAQVLSASSLVLRKGAKDI
jgi:hypothetical protein